MTSSLEQRMNRLPEASFHRRLVALIGGGLFFDAFDLYLAASVMVALQASGWASLEQTGQFAAAGAVGALGGACVAGFMGDRWGRRFAFQYNLMLFSIASIAGALAPSIHWLIAMRFLMGLGLGAEIVVGYAMVGEFVPAATRGKWGATLFLIAAAALPAANVAGYLLIPTFGWRWMFAIAGLGGITVWLLRRSIPESPRWLESVGRDGDALRIVEAIEISVALETGLQLNIPLGDAVVDCGNLESTALLTKWRLARLLAIGMTLNVVALGSLYGFTIWLPTFMFKQGINVANSLAYSMVMSMGSLVGAAVARMVADRWSRKYWIVVSSLASAAVGFAYTHAHTSEAMLAYGAILTGTLYFGAAIGFSTYVPELFPTDFRIRGTAISSAAGRAAAICAPFATVTILTTHGFSTVVCTMIGLIIFQAALVFILGVETRHASPGDALGLPRASTP